jgi:hypothetical protein
MDNTAIIAYEKWIILRYCLSVVIAIGTYIMQLDIRLAISFWPRLHDLLCMTARETMIRNVSPLGQIILVGSVIELHYGSSSVAELKPRIRTQLKCG